MHNLIQQGKILYWGTSEWTAQQITEAHYWAEKHNLIAPIMEQPQYNMFERKKMEQDYIPLFKTFGLGTTIWSPLASGILTGKYLDKLPEDSRMNLKNMVWLKDRSLSDTEKLNKVEDLHKLSLDLGISLTNMALCWCLKNPNVSTVILGASKLIQLEENLKCWDAMPKMTSDVMDKIEVILDNKPPIQEF